MYGARREYYSIVLPNSQGKEEIMTLPCINYHSPPHPHLIILISLCHPSTPASTLYPLCRKSATKTQIQIKMQTQNSEVKTHPHHHP